MEQRHKFINTVPKDNCNYCNHSRITKLEDKYDQLSNILKKIKSDLVRKDWMRITEQEFFKRLENELEKAENLEGEG